MTVPTTPSFEAQVFDIEEPTPPSRRAAVLSAAGLAVSVLIAILTVFPAQFAIGGPGPTFDTLAELDGVQLVEISGAPTFEASGELRLTTVSVSRGGSQLFTMGSVLAGYFSPTKYVRPEEYVFGTSDEENAVEERAAQDWITSQESATVSALEELGMAVPASIRVAGVQDDSNALGLLEEDDVIVAIDGTDIATYKQMSDAFSVHAPGDTVAVTVLRQGQEVTESITMLDAADGAAILGIWIDPTFNLPIDVTVQIDSVGGPSAGLMFSLGIMDKLTEQDELDGEHVAGTGTIDASGDVGPIGGIQFKMKGAYDAGADFFLAPVENCPDVIGHVPDGLSVFKVNTLDDAYAAVESIGSGDTSQLPTC